MQKYAGRLSKRQWKRNFFFSSFFLSFVPRQPVYFWCTPRKKRGENAITHHEPVKVLLEKKKLQKSGGKAGMREKLQEKGGCLLPYDNPENRRIDLDYLVIK